jgi:phage terminase small subunit
MANRSSPTHLKLLHGTYRKDRHEVKPLPSKPSSFPTCPKRLSGEARKRWSEVKKDMAEYGLIISADKALLEQYCILWGRFLQTPDEFTAALFAQFRYLSADLYLTPESRNKANLQKQQTEDDPLKKYGL